ncbi:MAG: hypothetical protein OXH63_09955 [Gemmatimonadetes bacterium]|nr:hypothetical protein [Gemmatimonadota bacterium]
MNTRLGGLAVAVAVLWAPAIAQEPEYDETRVDEMLDFHLNCYTFNQLLAFERTDLLVSRSRAARYHHTVVQLIVTDFGYASPELLVEQKSRQIGEAYFDGTISFDQIHSYVFDTCEEERRTGEPRLQEILKGEGE